MATTDQERALGLMFRRSLPENAGMLFLYDPPQPAAMWMKNTLIPLDMVFISADGKVHRIEQNTEPFSTTLIPSEGADRRRARAEWRARPTRSASSAATRSLYPGLPNGRDTAPVAVRPLRFRLKTSLRTPAPTSILRWLAGLLRRRAMYASDLIGA